MQRPYFAHAASAKNWQPILRLGALLGVALPLISCQAQVATESAQASGETGTLIVQANGEDFIREGFIDKDGWQMSFDHAYVTLANVSALQTDPAFEPETGKAPQVEEMVSSDRATTVDLAASTPTVAEFTNAPTGRYNALTWEITPADADEAAGHSVLLVGTATKANQQIAFEIGLNDAIAFTCGDYIGDARKGILNKAETTDVEATFHFDHIFGDGEAAADNDINVGALGFEPLAALATDGQLTIDSNQLKAQLSKEDYGTLQAVLPSLGHVGEGHCESTILDQ